MSKELFAAIERGDLDAVSDLLAKGEDPNRKSAEWPFWLPIEEAIHLIGEGGPAEMLVLLLRAGARLDEWRETTQEPRGDHPFMVMVMSRKPEGVRLLLAAGADPNLRTPEGISPLQWCVENGEVEIAATLLRCGAKATINEAAGLRAMTPLGQAAWLLDLPMMELLLRSGADPEACDLDDMTPRDRMPARDSSNDDVHDNAEALLRSFAKRSDGPGG